MSTIPSPCELEIDDLIKVTDATCGNQDGLIALLNPDYLTYYDILISDVQGYPYYFDSNGQLSVSANWYGIRFTIKPKFYGDFECKNKDFIWIEVKNSNTSITLNKKVIKNIQCTGLEDIKGRIDLYFDDSEPNGDYIIEIYNKKDELYYKKDHIPLYQLNPVLIPVDNEDFYYGIVGNYNNSCVYLIEPMKVNANSYNAVAGVSELYLAEWNNRIEYNYWSDSDEDWFDGSFDNDNTQSIKIKEFLTDLEWYHINVNCDNITYNQSMQKVKEGFVFNDKLTLSIPQLDNQKWRELTDVLVNKYIIVFKDNNGGWWVMGYRYGSNVNSYKREDNNLILEFNAVSDIDIVTAIDEDYIKNVIDPYEPPLNKQSGEIIMKINATGSTFTFTIPIFNGINVNVDWGDGVVEDRDDDNPQHTYTDAGEYIIKVKGVGDDLPEIRYIYFENIHNVIELKVSGIFLNLDYVKFRMIYELEKLDIGNLNTSTINNFREVLYYPTPNYTNLDFVTPISNWDVSNGTNFEFALAYLEFSVGDLSNWDVSKGEVFDSMFNGLQVSVGDLSNWNVSNGEQFNSMFSNLQVSVGDLSNWNVSSGVNFSNMFSNLQVSVGDLSNWDVSNGVSFREMFDRLQVSVGNLSNWDVSNGERFDFMFNELNVDVGNLDNWDVSNGVNFKRMFYMLQVSVGDLSGWNVGKGEVFGYMFSDLNVDVGNLDNWNVSKGVDFTCMFQAIHYPVGDLSNWNVSSGDRFDKMFRLLQVSVGDLTNWQFKQDANLYYMFQSASLNDPAPEWWNIWGDNVQHLYTFYDNTNRPNYGDIPADWK